MRCKVRQGLHLTMTGAGNAMETGRRPARKERAPLISFAFPGLNRAIRQDTVVDDVPVPIRFNGTAAGHHGLEHFPAALHP